MISGATGDHLWSESFQRRWSVEDVIAVQADIAREVTGRLKAMIAPDEQARIAAAPTENTEAYDAFLWGRHHLRQGVGERAFRTAIQFFDRALALDSSFAAAYSGLGEAYAWLAIGNIDAPADTWPYAREATDRALELDESLTAAHTVRALERAFYQHDWQGAETEFRRSLEINPDQADTRLYYSWLLAVLQRNGDALTRIAEAKRLDPRSPWVDMMRAWTLMFLKRFDEAHRIADGMNQAEPPDPVGLLLEAQTLIEEGRFEDALAPLRAWTIVQGDDIADETALMAMLNGLLGRQEEARRYADELEVISAQGRWVSPMPQAWASIGLGDADRTFQLLEEGRQQRDMWIPLVAGVQFLTPGIGDDPRFKSLRQRMGLEE